MVMYTGGNTLAQVEDEDNDNGAFFSSSLSMLWRSRWAGVSTTLTARVGTSGLSSFSPPYRADRRTMVREAKTEDEGDASSSPSSSFSVLVIAILVPAQGEDAQDKNKGGIVVLRTTRERPQAKTSAGELLPKTLRLQAPLICSTSH
jgi:hypothetical protein